jgi:putative sugar O-methyltransferase
VSTSADIGMDAVLSSMFDELRQADPIYHPSRFWEFHGTAHLELLRRRGLEAFKQALNNSYFNWLPRTWDDNQLRNLLESWCRNPDRRPLLARFTSHPTLDWVHPGIPLATDEQWFIHALFVGLLWYYTLQTDRYSLLARLEEPQVGKPFPIEIEGKRVSQDLANSVREYNSIRDGLEASGLWDDHLTLGELGAGYGRLAYVFAKAAPGRYIVFDIPPTLHVSQWYLSRVCPEKRVFAFRPFRRFAEIEGELAESSRASSRSAHWPK